MKAVKAQILAYPGPLTRAGVKVVQETPKRLVITIPGTSILQIPHPQAAILAFALVAISVAMRWVVPNVHPEYFTTVGFSLAMALMITSLRGRPTILRIESGELYARFPYNDNVRNRPPPPMPIDAIYRIYYVPHARAVFLRAHGSEMLEIAVAHSEAVAIALERLLNQVLLGRNPDDLSKPESVV